MPVGCQFIPEDPDHDFISRHVMQTRYGIQIVKCMNTNCCEPFKTNWMSVIKSQFLPAPAIYEFTNTGLKAVEPSAYINNPKQHKFASLRERIIMNILPNEAENYTRPPFDLYCPSMQEKLEKGICTTCGKYWPSEAA